MVNSLSFMDGVEHITYLKGWFYTKIAIRPRTLTKRNLVFIVPAYDTFYSLTSFFLPFAGRLCKGVRKSEGVLRGEERVKPNLFSMSNPRTI